MDSSHTIPPWKNSYPDTPSNGTTPVVPVNPDGPTPGPTPVNPNNGGGEGNWFKHNGLYVAIGGGVVILVLLVLLSWVCYKRRNKPDPYMMQKYTAVSEEEIRLDEEQKQTHDALNESKAEYNDFEKQNPKGTKYP